MSGIDSDPIAELKRRGDATSTIAGMIYSTPIDQLVKVADNILMPAQSANVENFKRINIQYQPTTSFASSFFATTQNSYFDVKIDRRSACGILKRADLNMYFTVSTNPVTLLPTPFWFNKIQIMFNSPNISEQYASPYEIFWDQLSATDYNEVASGVWPTPHNTTSALAVGSALAASASPYRRVLSLPASLLNVLKLFPYSIAEDIVIRFYPQNFGLLSTAGAVGDIVMNNIFLNVSYDYLPPTLAAQRLDYLNSAVQVFPFISPVSYQLGSNVAVTTSSFSMNFNGASPGLIGGVVLFATDATVSTAAATYTIRDMSNWLISMQDSNNMNIVNPSYGDYLRYDNATENGELTLYNPNVTTCRFFPISFYNNKDNTVLVDGQVRGCYYLKGDEKITLQPDASSGTNVNVWALILYYRYATIKNGKISVNDA